MIVVDRHGENAIVVAGGANRLLTASDLLAERRTIETAVVLTVQLEIPYDTVACAVALAKRSNVLTILDPAPAPPEGLPERVRGPPRMRRSAAPRPEPEPERRSATRPGNR